MSNEFAVALYRRGPLWDRSRPIGEQDGLQGHFAYMGRLMGDGTIERGGPFYRADELVEGELVALAVYTVPVAEATRLAAADPAVAAGLMECDVMPWYT
ncbi:MAG TPA: hypothetical protein VFR32_09765 [Gaiellaceae bacterium]|nr:hypothetical protein [Gaiellaceae bacterium]